MEEKSKTHTQMRNEFYEKFRERIVPQLQYFENQRKSFLKELILIYIPCLIIVIAIIAVSLYFKVENNLLIGVCVALLLIPYSLYARKCYKLEAQIREKTIKEVCNIIGNVKYNPSMYYIDPLVTKKWLIIDPQGGCHVYNTFEGIYKNVKYIKRDVSFKEWQRDKYICGMIASFKFNKNFKSKTLILPDTFYKKSFATLRHTVLEDIYFEYKYDVYTDDEVEARYLITPVVMEKLSALKTKFNFKEIRISFVEGELFVALLGEKDPCDRQYNFADEAKYFKIYDDLISIIKIIDYLDLDKKNNL